MDDAVVFLFNKCINNDTRCKCSDSLSKNAMTELATFITPPKDNDLCHYSEPYKIYRKKLITLDNLHKDYYNVVDQDDDI